MFPRRSCENVFAMYSLNVPPDNKKGFHNGMTWEDICLLVNDLCTIEESTLSDENLSLYYTYKYFR